jgi:hypothetical protein
MMVFETSVSEKTFVRWEHGPTAKGITAMAEARVGIRIADDRKTAALVIAPVGEEAAQIELSLDQLTNLIGLLGETRSRMVEGSPTQPLEGRAVRTVTRPNWYIQVAHIDGSLLAFDHPAFGPVGFAIPREEIVKIVQLLNKHLALPAGPTTKRN